MVLSVSHFAAPSCPWSDLSKPIAEKIVDLVFDLEKKLPTVTAGLQTVFTTPAHGTAFDIVGQGKADPGAMEHALRLAARLAAARRASSISAYTA